MGINEAFDDQRSDENNFFENVNTSQRDIDYNFVKPSSPMRSPESLAFNTSQSLAADNKPNSIDNSVCEGAVAVETKVHSPMFFVPRSFKDRDRNTPIHESVETGIDTIDPVVKAAAEVVRLGCRNQLKGGENMKSVVAEALGMMLQDNTIDAATHRRLSMSMGNMDTPHNAHGSITIGIKGDGHVGEGASKDDVLTALRNYIDSLDIGADSNGHQYVQETVSEPTEMNLASNRSEDIEDQAVLLDHIVEPQPFEHDISLTDRISEAADQIDSGLIVDNILCDLEEQVDKVSSSSSVVLIPGPDIDTKVSCVPVNGFSDKVAQNQNQTVSAKSMYPMQALLDRALSEHRVLVTLKDWIVLKDHVTYQLFIEVTKKYISMASYSYHRIII